MNNVEYFLDLEKEAVKLSENVKNIYDEIGSYKEAKMEFLETAKALLLLVEKTDKLLTNSHNVIGKMNEIGMPEILSKIETLKNDLLEMKTGVSKSISNEISKMTLEIEDRIQKLREKISEDNQKHIEDKIQQLTKKLNEDNQQLTNQLVTIDRRIRLNSLLIISSIVLTLANLLVLFIK